MKVLFLGDAYVSTGFARCTHAACDALHDDGHDVSVLGVSYYGDPHDYLYPIHPCFQPIDGGHDYMGVTRLPVLCERLKPDVLVILTDPWNIPGYVNALHEEIRPKHIIGWLAVDALNMQGHELNDRLDHVVVWTDFAETELIRSGYKGPISKVPLGVDHDIYVPMDRRECRLKVGGGVLLPEYFLVGVVARNQPRKRLDLAISGFLEWLSKTPEAQESARLLIHTCPTGEKGIDIAKVVRYYSSLYGLQDKVIANTPSNVGLGAPEASMPMLYNSMDAYLCTSQSEGWCLPALEAMACGIPCILPEFAGLDWSAGAAWHMDCGDPVPNAPMNHRMHTLAKPPKKDEIVSALSAVYANPALRNSLKYSSLDRAAEYSWGRTGLEFSKVVQSVADQGHTQDAESPKVDRPIDGSES